MLALDDTCRRQSPASLHEVTCHGLTAFLLNPSTILSLAENAAVRLMQRLAMQRIRQSRCGQSTHDELPGLHAQSQEPWRLASKTTSLICVKICGLWTRYRCFCKVVALSARHVVRQFVVAIRAGSLGKTPQIFFFRARCILSLASALPSPGDMPNCPRSSHEQRVIEIDSRSLKIPALSGRSIDCRSSVLRNKPGGSSDSMLHHAGHLYHAPDHPLCPLELLASTGHYILTVSEICSTPHTLVNASFALSRAVDTACSQLRQLQLHIR